MRSATVVCVGVLASMALSLTSAARDFYIDPQSGSPDGDGSAARPWRTLQEVLAAHLIEGRQCETLPWQADCTMTVRNPNAPVKPGDTLKLRTGYHGAITIQDAYLEQPLTVEADAGHQPAFSTLRCLGAGNWIFRGISISPSHVEPYQPVADLVMLENHNFRGPCREVTVEDCVLFSMWDTTLWTIDDWNNLPASGIQIQGPDNLVRRNYLRNVDFGISASGPRARVIGNVVENFAGDGLRGLGDEDVFEDNLVMNCYAVNANHDDGFQSWSVGPGGVGTGEVRGVVLRRNTIINYVDPEQPFRGTLQGIGCFDGFRSQPRHRLRLGRAALRGLRRARPAPARRQPRHRSGQPRHGAGGRSRRSGATLWRRFRHRRLRVDHGTAPGRRDGRRRRRGHGRRE